MILLTGGVGFIGSNVLAELNKRGIYDTIIVDILANDGRYRNVAKHSFYDIIFPHNLSEFLNNGKNDIHAVIHLGAISSTLEQDADVIYEQNVLCSMMLWQWCSKWQIPLVYASSAATYGDGSLGFVDNLNWDRNKHYLPLNPYGWSKHFFDQFCLKNQEQGNIAPPQWNGLKFFNVYGPNEYHKIGQHSVAHNLYHQIKNDGVAKLFKSYRPDYSDGGQIRDFVFVSDCVDVILWLLDNPQISGKIINVGSGVGRTFNDLANAVFVAMNKKANIQYIDMPEILQKSYQYTTSADLSTLRQLGYQKEMVTLEDGVKQYIVDYLATEDPYC